MGSYNIRCSLTDFTITPGQSVVVIPLIAQRGYKPVDVHDFKGTHRKVESAFHSTCYPTAFWNPLICPIYGTYNDYSKITLDTEMPNIDRVRYLFQHLRGWAFSTDAGDNKHFDKSFDPLTLPKFSDEIEAKDIPKIEDHWHSVRSLVNEGRIFVRDYSGNPLQLQFMVVWRPAFENAIRLHTDFDVSFKTGLAQVEQKIEDLRQIKTELKHKFKEADLYTFDAFRDIQAWHNHSDYGSLMIWQDFIQEEVMGNIGKFDSLKSTMGPFIKVMLLVAAFDEFRKPIIPMTTTGQDYQNDHGHRLVNFLTRMDQLWSQNYLEENGESRFGGDEED